MIIFYLLIVLYDRNYRIIVIMWKPFRYFIAQFRKNLDARTSVIDAFATFFFLSKIKFLGTSSYLLYPTWVFQLYPNHYNSTMRLFYSPDVAYYRRRAPSLCHTSDSCVVRVCLVANSSPLSLSFPSLSEVSKHLSWSLVHPRHLCGLLSWLLQRWNRTRHS